MTVLEVIQRSTAFLGEKGVSSPRLHSELLLAYALKIPRMQLYLNFERALTDTESNTIREFIRRRGQREPVQQIMGSTNFCGIELKLDRSVLVPRPETELLAEHGWKFLQALIAKDTPAPRAFDLGTGSGCIAIALALHAPTAEIIANDASADALKVASGNAQRLHVAERIQFVQEDGFSFLANTKPLHLLISNPPYIPGAEIDTLEPEVSKFEPRSALDGGPDGLEFFRRLASSARDVLLPAGKIMAEFGDGQEQRLEEIFTREMWIVEAIERDYTGRPRFLVASLRA